MPPKRKQTKQYSDSKDVEEDDDDKQPNSKKTMCDVANVSEISNNTNIGQLYTNAINNNSNIVNNPTTLFMGTTKYTVNSIYNPVLIFNDYFMFVLNSVCGYIANEDYSIDQIRQNPANTLSHMFLSILYYNNIIIPLNITIQKHESNMILGECLYYNKCYDKNELNIHICNNLIMEFLDNEDTYDMTFSKKINYEQYSMKENLQQFKDDIVITSDMYKLLVSLFVIGDHAATHYIEDYVLGKTDWIHHFCFAKEINMFTLINTIFSISANITNLDTTPKLIVDSKKGPSIEGMADIEKIFNSNVNVIENINSVNTFSL